jgi:hypothetical protein
LTEEVAIPSRQVVVSIIIVASLAVLIAVP